LAHVELQPRAFEDALQDESAPTVDSVDASADAATEPEPVEQAEPPPPPTSKSVTAPAAVDGGRYVVQVASFGSTGNAKRMAETLRGSGYAVLTDKVSSDVGTLHRVRVGPYASETEAKAAVTRLRQQLSDVKPRVVDLQPERAAQVTTPSDPLVRWVVQLGSFSSSANAERLVERARAEGFSAYKEEISSSGATIHRVRVGPFLERDEAIRVDGLIGERLAMDGVVMSAD
jgi:DedD protein